MSTALALGLNQILDYAGYVLVVGTLTFWVFVWPDGRSERTLVRLTAIGTVSMTVATFGAPLVEVLLVGRPVTEVLTPLNGASALVRLAALAATAFFLTDLVRAAVRGWRRLFALTVVAVLAATLVVQSDALHGPARTLKVIVTSGHVLATGTWLGGLVALAAVLLRRQDRAELGGILPRFSRVTTASVLVLALTGGGYALLQAGGLAPLVGTDYGLALAVKTGVFVIMLVLGSYARRSAARLAFRRTHHPVGPADDPGDAVAHGTRTVAVLMGVEVSVAVLLLAATSWLVQVAPPT